jgi:hypothetical protein
LIASILPDFLQNACFKSEQAFCPLKKHPAIRLQSITSGFSEFRRESLADKTLKLLEKYPGRHTVRWDMARFRASGSENIFSVRWRVRNFRPASQLNKVKR